MKDHSLLTNFKSHHVNIIIIVWMFFLQLVLEMRKNEDLYGQHQHNEIPATCRQHKVSPLCNANSIQNSNHTAKMLLGLRVLYVSPCDTYAE